MASDRDRPCGQGVDQVGVQRRADQADQRRAVPESADLIAGRGVDPQDDVGLPRVVRRADARAGRGVGLVGKAAGRARAGLDDHVVAEGQQLGRPWSGWRPPVSRGPGSPAELRYATWRSIRRREGVVARPRWPSYAVRGGPGGMMPGHACHRREQGRRCDRQHARGRPADVGGPRAVPLPTGAGPQVGCGDTVRRHAFTPLGGLEHVRVERGPRIGRHSPQQAPVPLGCRSNQTATGAPVGPADEPPGHVMEERREDRVRLDQCRTTTTWCRRRSSPRSSTARP